MKTSVRSWRFNVVAVFLALGLSCSSSGLAETNFLKGAQAVTALGRLAVIPANRAELLQGKHAELLQLLADGLRLSNELLSLYNRPKEGWYYKGAWAAHDALHMSKTIYNLFTKKPQSDGQQQLSLDVDSKKLNDAIFYLRSYLLPVTETAAATFIAFDDGVELSSQKKRVAAESVMSLSRLFSDYLLTNKNKAKVYEAVLFVHAVLTIKEFWALFDKKVEKNRYPRRERQQTEFLDVDPRKKSYR